MSSLTIIYVGRSVTAVRNPVVKKRKNPEDNELKTYTLQKLNIQMVFISESSCVLFRACW